MSDAVQKSEEVLSLERALAITKRERDDSYVRHSEDLQRLRSVTADLKSERDLREQVNHLAVEALQRADTAEKRCAKLAAEARMATLGLDHCAAALGIGEWDPHDALNAIMQLQANLAAAKKSGGG